MILGQTNWTQEEAIALCRAVEKVCPAYGCHVALTGGCLYKDGVRKDCDLIFYRIRQTPKIDVEGLFEALKAVGLYRLSGFGWIYKANWHSKPVDCLFPEEQGGDPSGKYGPVPGVTTVTVDWNGNTVET